MVFTIFSLKKLYYLSPTTLIKPVDFQFVDVTEGCCLAKFHVPVVLGNKGWLSIH